MRVSDVLQIGRPYKTYVIAGEGGLHRKVTSIEVMEVPDLDRWITEGAFFITTFYSVKDNIDAQIKVMEALTNKKAAGIMVKLGRFIEALPAQFIYIANENNVPIIILPKEVSYISILTPLYARLHMNEMSYLPESAYYLYEIERKSYQYIDELLNDLSEKLQSAIYIEDMHGGLLFHSSLLQKDGWRSQFLLFTRPTYTNYEKRLQEWKLQLREVSSIHSTIHGLRNRVIIPLIEKNDQVAFIHIVSSRNEARPELHPMALKIIHDKIYVTWISELIQLQQQRIVDRMLSTPSKEDTNQYDLLYVDRALNYSLLNADSTFIDYMCIYRKYIAHSMEEFTKNEFSMIEFGEKIFVLLHDQIDRNDSDLLLEERLKNAFASTIIADVRIAVSNHFINYFDVQEQMKSTMKIMEIGQDLYPDKRVFSYNQLGIYTYLLSLSNDENVQLFAEQLLDPLLQADVSLLETLNVYMEENSNASRAAQILFVNRRTINYRLQRIQQLLQMDLKNADSIFVIQFCLKMMKLAK